MASPAFIWHPGHMAEPSLPGTGHQLDLLRDQLRRLHLHAGKPSTREIARRIGSNVISHTTVHSVLRCAICPRWGNLELVVEALGGDIEEFRPIWISVQETPRPRSAGRADAPQGQHMSDDSDTAFPGSASIPSFSGIDYSKSSAVLIGVSNYHDDKFPDLPAARNSLAGMEQILTDPNVGGWPKERVSVFQDPDDVRDLTLQLRRIAERTSDLLLVYHVGHGTVLPRGELCLALSDTLSEHPDITGLEYSRVREALLDSPARAKVAILDCCYSGRAIEAMSDSDGIADIVEVEGAYTLTASDRYRTAHVPANQADACTSFTGQLLDLLRGGLPGGPIQFQLDQLYPELRQRLMARSLPLPNVRGTGTVGKLPFCRNVAYTGDPATSDSPATTTRSDTTTKNAEPGKSASVVPNGEVCSRCGAWAVDPLRHHGWHESFGG